MSAQELITKHLDVWTSAHKTRSIAGRGSNNKLNLHGIKKLRELILELAVRGKLVPQDPSDEPASELLKKIAVEKEKLIKEGKIKKEKSLTEITDEEKPFELPSGWECIRLGKIATIKGGKRLPNGHSFSVEETPHVYIRVTDMKNGTINDEGLVYIRPETHSLISQYVISSNDLYITIAGTIGAVGVVPQQFNGMNLTENAAKIIFRGVEKSWLQKTLSSRYIQEQFNEKTNQLAQPKLALHRIESSIVFLPPLAEQHRIVAKVDELMAFCDQLEQTQSDNIAAHAQLVEALLATLTNSSDHNELQINWQRIATHFDTLFTTEHSIDQLKQTILQLAVMGKLIPQNPNDEPASELLKTIVSEKERLVKEKRFQKASNLKPKSNLDWLPENWVAVQTGEVCPSIVPNRDKPQSFSGDIPWVTLPSFPEDGFSLDVAKVELGLTYEEVEKYSARLIPANSVLMSCVGRFGMVAINRIPVTSNQQIHAFIMIDGLLPEYLCFVIKVAADILQATSTSTTVAYLNKTNCESIDFGLPPIAEQHRIVTKVDELMALCDTLKTNLQNAQTTQLALADALVEQAVG